MGTRNRQWEDASVFWSGEVNKGKHSAYLRSPQANIWGCQSDWGDLDIAVVPSSTGIKAYQTPDKRRGCPPSAKANAPLIKKDSTLGTASVIMAQGPHPDVLVQQTMGGRHRVLDWSTRQGQAQRLPAWAERQHVGLPGPVGRPRHHRHPVLHWWQLQWWRWWQQRLSSGRPEQIW